MSDTASARKRCKMLGVSKDVLEIESASVSLNCANEIEVGGWVFEWRTEESDAHLYIHLDTDGCQSPGANNNEAKDELGPGSARDNFTQRKMHDKMDSANVQDVK